NTGGGATSSLDMQRIGELAPMLIADRQARRGLTAPWANGKNGKEYRAAMGRKPIVGIFSVGVEEPYRWKDSGQSEAEIRLGGAEGGGGGLASLVPKFSRRAAGPGVAQAGGGPLPPLRTLGEIPAQRAPARSPRAGLFPAVGLVSRRQGRRSHARLVSGAHRS